ncbi:type II toxin-antitoxin system RelE/ParE family toxin [uncultured Cyclobacterium sp.]|uniref:type II toxin-antitoxin system RelE/ParE family toxin n=1 Tax=uncultured Cyclobacterium sp. TaxID=453820 RepID=UPI0030EE8010|tara:strand:+ start:16804 stop:17100 length:297 start_codon:yes stop_codon:yes gene_type:complete
MGYNIIVSPRSQKEIENAIEYYSLHSSTAPLNFITALKEAYATLKTNPFFKVVYRNIRSLKLKKFPHSLYFVLNENQNTVRILSCFHNKRNPVKRPGL